MQMNTTGFGAMTWPTKKSFSPSPLTGEATSSQVVKAVAAPAPAGGATPPVAASGTPAPVVRGASSAGYADGVTREPSSTAAADSADGTEDRFLQLLVAQMRNQDPMNPMDNAEVTSQLAQISTVRGIEGMNKTMTQMLAATAQNSAVSSVPMLGKQVLVAGDGFAFQPAANGAATRLGFELKSPATAARLEIVNSAGAVVHTRTMGSVKAGMETFVWDGRNSSGGSVPAGPLSVRITAVDGATAVGATTLVPARVVGISQSAGATQLELDGAAPVAPSDVRLIL